MGLLSSDNFDNWVKGEKFKAWVEPLLGDGIFAVDGAPWLDQRKMASHMFSKRDLIAMVEIFKSHYDGFESSLHDGEPIEMQELLRDTQWIAFVRTPWELKSRA